MAAWLFAGEVEIAVLRGCYRAAECEVVIVLARTCSKLHDHSQTGLRIVNPLIDADVLSSKRYLLEFTSRSRCRP